MTSSCSFHVSLVALTMAQKRMIDKKISVSEQVADLSLKAQIIYTWSIPHADDLGLLPYSHKTLRAIVVPLMDITLEDFGIQMESIVHQGLMKVFEHEGQKYYQILNFHKHQTLKKDRKPVTLLGKIEDWSDLDSIGFQLEDIGNPREEKRREVKGREEKIYVQSFEKFWSVFPRKINKQTALKSWLRLKPSDELIENIVRDVSSRASSESWSKESRKFCPHPSTYLNNRRWEDEVIEEEKTLVIKN